MKIHIIGAAGVGKTTLGNALAQQLNIPYFDSDDYFWHESEVAFTVRRNPEERNALLLAEMARHTDWIVGGSMISWGINWRGHFDLLVFLRLPGDIRLQRIKDRELERYGDTIYNDRAQLYQDFITWAEGYEDLNFKGRSLWAHQDWLAQMDCPILEIADDTTTAQRIERIINAYNQLK